MISYTSSESNWNRSLLEELPVEICASDGIPEGFTLSSAVPFSSDESIPPLARNSSVLRSIHAFKRSLVRRPLLFVRACTTYAGGINSSRQHFASAFACASYFNARTFRKCWRFLSLRQHPSSWATDYFSGCLDTPYFDVRMLAVQ